MVARSTKRCIHIHIGTPHRTISNEKYHTKQVIDANIFILSTKNYEYIFGNILVMRTDKMRLTNGQSVSIFSTNKIMIFLFQTPKKKPTRHKATFLTRKKVSRSHCACLPYMFLCSTLAADGVFDSAWLCVCVCVCRSRIRTLCEYDIFSRKTKKSWNLSASNVIADELYDTTLMTFFFFCFVRLRVS